jgi:O-acetyl-ADP-ribose deacetylase (regulator of RNase III)
MPISYVIGDATEPIGQGPHAIMHINNNVGTWGGGFVLAVSDKWPIARKVYLDDKSLMLGDIQIIPVEENISVINMVAQDDFPTNEFPVAVDYEALADCFWEITRRVPTKVTLHAPRIGTGIAGGDWNEIELRIHQELGDYNVIIYDLPGSKFLTDVE